MTKLKRKLRITIPKALAEQFGIEPGDELTGAPHGDSLSLVPPRGAVPLEDPGMRLRLFDAASERQLKRQRGRARIRKSGRGLTRDELNRRGRAR